MIYFYSETLWESLRAIKSLTTQKGREKYKVWEAGSASEHREVHVHTATQPRAFLIIQLRGRPRVYHVLLQILSHNSFSLAGHSDF